MRKIKMIASIVTALIGVVVGFLMVRVKQYPHVFAGIVLAFILVGLFILCFNTRNKKLLIAAIIAILTGGAWSGYAIGYRPRMAGSGPWKWINPGAGDYGYIAVAIRSRFDWIAAIIPWAIFFMLAVVLFARLTQTPKTKEVETSEKRDI